MLTETEKEILRKKFVKHEGKSPHMYLDSKGYVTVGVGHLIITLAEAQRLEFFTNEGTKATTKQIEEEYNCVKKLSNNRTIFYYKKYTNLYLKNRSIDELTNWHIIKFEKELKKIYPKFDDYPINVRLALLDMIFSLGATKLKNRYPIFNDAIEREDWKKAADNSNRKDAQLDRNEYVKKLLIDAAANEEVKK